VTIEIGRLVDVSDRVDTVVGWLLDEWPDPVQSRAARKARLLDTAGCPPALLAVSRGEPCGVLGFARFRRDGDEDESLFIDALYVHQSARNRGIGTALLDAGVDAATAFAPRLFVYTSVAAWYQRRGWDIVEPGAAANYFVLARSLGRPTTV
jgi:GNAT superfamily N-acetyltransferase